MVVLTSWAALCGAHASKSGPVELLLQLHQYGSSAELLVTESVASAESTVKALHAENGH